MMTMEPVWTTHAARRVIKRKLDARWVLDFARRMLAKNPPAPDAGGKLPEIVYIENGIKLVMAGPVIVTVALVAPPKGGVRRRRKNRKYRSVVNSLRRLRENG